MLQAFSASYVTCFVTTQVTMLMVRGHMQSTDFCVVCLGKDSLPIDGALNTGTCHNWVTSSCFHKQALLTVDPAAAPE